MPSKNFLMSLNEALGVSYDWLLSGSGLMFIEQEPESTKAAPHLTDERTKEAINALKDCTDLREAVLIIRSMPEEKRRAVFDYIHEKKRMMEMEQAVREMQRRFPKGPCG